MSFNIRKTRSKRAQSSFELLITVSFGLIILIPVVVLAFIQISASNSNLAATEAQAAASKLASIATSIGAQGYPAKQLALIQVPPNVQNVYVGTQGNGVGHSIIFVITTSGGTSDVTAYTPINVSGLLASVSVQGTYLINVSAQNTCPSNPSLPCVYMQPA